jgi:hypothetical protein
MGYSIKVIAFLLFLSTASATLFASQKHNTFITQGRSLYGAEPYFFFYRYGYAPKTFEYLLNAKFFIDDCNAWEGKKLRALQYEDYYVSTSTWSTLILTKFTYETWKIKEIDGVSDPLEYTQAGRLNEVINIKNAKYTYNDWMIYYMYSDDNQIVTSSLNKTSIHKKGYYNHHWYWAVFYNYDSTGVNSELSVEYFFMRSGKIYIKSNGTFVPYYDSDGKIIDEMQSIVTTNISDSSVDTTFTRIKYIYDPYGNVIERITQKRERESLPWQDSLLYRCVYNLNNQPTEEVLKINHDSSWTDSVKCVFTYNSEGRENDVTLYHKIEDTFVPNRRVTFLYEDPTGIDKSTKIDIHKSVMRPWISGSKMYLQLTSPNTVSLDIYSVSGKKIASVIKGKPMTAGVHKIHTDDTLKRKLADGVYIYELKIGSHFQKGILQVF